MEGGPRRQAAQSRCPHQEMRFHRVALNHRRLPILHRRAQPRHDRRVEAARFRYRINGNGQPLGRFDRQVRFVAPLEDGDGRFHAPTLAGALRELQQVLGGARDGSGFENRQQTDGFHCGCLNQRQYVS